MHPEFQTLLAAAGLERYEAAIRASALDAVGFTVAPESAEPPVGASKFGGSPDVPPGFDWPVFGGRRLDYVLQINLEEVAPFDSQALLPREGRLLFFWDIKETPWGYDPKNRLGHRVAFFPAEILLEPSEVPDATYWSPPRPLVEWHCRQTIPHCGSLACDRLEREFGPYEDHQAYWEFTRTYDNLWLPAEVRQQKFPNGHHQLLGHSYNVQNDMQMQAEVVSNGIYLGHGLRDSPHTWEDLTTRFGAGADDWLLLLQFDCELLSEWAGDPGDMLYYWIRRQDLAARQFDSTWMTFQGT